MTINDYKALLNDFYEGKTTLEQEKALRNFFESKEIPASLLNEQQLFLSCFKTDDLEIPPALIGKINTLINEKAGIQSTIPSGKVIRTQWIWIGTIAASFLLLFAAIGIREYRTNLSSIYTDTFTNPQDAAWEAQRALQLVSKNLSTGYSQVNYAKAKFNKAGSTVNKQLTKIAK